MAARNPFGQSFFCSWNFFSKREKKIVFILLLCIGIVFAKVNFVSAETTSSDYSLAAVISAILGPAYCLKINENFFFIPGFGIHFAETTLSSSAGSELDFSFGLGPIRLLNML